MEAQRAKHKYDNLWKIGCVIATILAIIFMCLYFCSGDLVKQTTINSTTEIQNENQGDNGSIHNENINTVTTETSSNVGLYILISVIIFVGGGLIGCHIISQSHCKQHSKSDE